MGMVRETERKTKFQNTFPICLKCIILLFCDACDRDQNVVFRISLHHRCVGLFSIDNTFSFIITNLFSSRREIEGP